MTVYQTRQKVLFKHCDPAGIVFYPRAFEIVNDAVEAFFDEGLGWPFEALLTTHGVPTVDTHTRFVAPMRHGDWLDLTLRVTRVGRTSLGYRLEACCDGQERFTTEAVLVLTDGAGRPTPWPDAIRAKLTEDGA